MGRPPGNGVPAFRFNATEITEMEAILQDHNNALPSREIMIALAEKFSDTSERKGQIIVQMKQVWNWFQNKRYALRAKNSRANPGDPNISPLTRDDSGLARNVLEPAASGSFHIPMTAPVPATVPVTAQIPAPVPVPAPIPAPSVQPVGSATSENSSMEFEAKSARDGAWYDVQCFLAHRNFEHNPEVQVRFVGFGPDDDEWVNVRKNARPRSLPCEPSECVAVLPGDLILCFQEGKDQALYFDAHVLDAQRRRHDARGCRCRFLVRYDHDLAEEIVSLRKVCRRPQTDYRLQQLHAATKGSASVDQKTNIISAASVSGFPRPNNSSTATMQKLTNSGFPIPHPTATPTVTTSTPAVMRINTVPIATPTFTSIPTVMRINTVPIDTPIVTTSTPNITRINSVPILPKPSNPGIHMVPMPSPIPHALIPVAAKSETTANASTAASISGPTSNFAHGGSAANTKG